MLGRLVSWVSDADYKINTRWQDWNFLWAEWTLTLATGISEYSPPTLLGMFDTDGFWIDSLSDDARKIPYIPYEKFKRGYKHFTYDDGETDMITVLPNKQVKVWPEPTASESGKVIKAEYWKKPTRLANNSDISAIPTQFHGLIIWRAKMFHAAYRHDNGLYQQAVIEYERMLKELEAHSLPDQYNNRLSSATDPYVIQVA